MLFMILFFGRVGEVYITDVALTEFGILGEDIYIYIYTRHCVKQAMLGRNILEKNAGNEELPIIDISAVRCNVLITVKKLEHTCEDLVWIQCSYMPIYQPAMGCLLGRIEEKSL